MGVFNSYRLKLLPGYLFELRISQHALQRVADGVSLHGLQRLPADLTGLVAHALHFRSWNTEEEEERRLQPYSTDDRHTLLICAWLLHIQQHQATRPRKKKNGLDDGNSKKEILTKKLKSVVGVGVNEVAWAVSEYPASRRAIKMPSQLLARCFISPPTYTNESGSYIMLE